ncbi:hypothetical protein A2765_02280 [Candidatus Kaiserbacteria bacterium RIFCSPHIGHO2_01_FULL_56_24]|uniref:Uncharacterized protein n=1 Tax=Candidatus Kaiserbacteria bacterium RIFCSPHIGHO2_01_FULL_56_24 TaxID=1798487 RepID=A0A1F6DBZ0_9BACT|nr:MAG: hypothetical protein A2765_02280 [Candidatus Kaiserbacteria bacterium RIFCSPHIGHO2_01_FULL_56_24]
MNSGRYGRRTFRRFVAGMFALRKGVRSEASQGRRLLVPRRGRAHFQQEMMRDGENCSFPRGEEQRSVENREVLKNKGRRLYSRGASSIAITAALSLAILIAAVGSYIGEKAQTRKAITIDLSQEHEPAEPARYAELADADNNGVPDWRDELMRGGVAISTSSPATSTASTDPVTGAGTSMVSSLISGYLSLKQYDAYTPARGEKLADTIASGFRAPTIFVPHPASELDIDADVSQKRVLQYRSDMRTALAPMVDLDAEPEFSLFARFIATGDASWLDKLSAVTAKYREAEGNMLKVRVPASAADTHLRAVNALGEFTETLERLVRFSKDPLALLALLRTYNEDEREFLLAFDALAKFYVQNVSNK